MLCFVGRKRMYWVSRTGPRRLCEQDDVLLFRDTSVIERDTQLDSLEATEWQVFRGNCCDRQNQQAWGHLQDMTDACVPHMCVYIRVQQAVCLQIYAAWLVPASWHQSKGGSLALRYGDTHSPGDLAEWTPLAPCDAAALFPPPGPLPKGISLVQFSRSVMSDCLRPHEPQHARPHCPCQRA